MYLFHDGVERKLKKKREINKNFDHYYESAIKTHTMLKYFNHISMRLYMQTLKQITKIHAVNYIFVLNY